MAFAGFAATAPGATQSQPATAPNPAPPAARDGGSVATAVIINARDEKAGVDAEYAWIRANIPGGRPDGQALESQGGKPYDLIHVRLPDGSLRDVYFDISGFFGKF